MITLKNYCNTIVINILSLNNYLWSTLLAKPPRGTNIFVLAICSTVWGVWTTIICLIFSHTFFYSPAAPPPCAKAVQRWRGGQPTPPVWARLRRERAPIFSFYFFILPSIHWGSFSGDCDFRVSKCSLFFKLYTSYIFSSMGCFWYFRYFFRSTLVTIGTKSLDS
jgi:hypothetical protein